MKTAKLVKAKISLVFHSFSIETGPLIASNDAIWTDIASSLALGKVESAAAPITAYVLGSSVERPQNYADSHMRCSI